MKIESSDTTDAKEKPDDALKLMRKRFDDADERGSEQRLESREDRKFIAGDQWPQEIKNARSQDNRPTLMVNRLPQFKRQITNDLRQNRPAIKVNPVDDTADLETAEAFQGLIRHIEYDSGADTAYDTAVDSQVTGGLGYFLIATEYVSPVSFDLEVKIKRILDPDSVYFDPNSTEPDGSDAQFAFLAVDFTKDEFKARWPNAKCLSADFIKEDGDKWITDDNIRVAAYYSIEHEEKTLNLMEDGSIVEGTLPEDTNVVKKKTAQVPKVMHRYTNGHEFLEETVFPGRYIPIIPVIGEEVVIEGKRSLYGIVRFAKDPQRMLNYWVSAETEAIALAPRTPWIGAEGQFEGHEAQWKTANTKNHPYLQYKPTMLDNEKAAPPPSRAQFEPAVAAITQARMQSSEDLKATTGIYDAAMGAGSNEKSGVAIQRRANQSQTANFHFSDNLSRSLKHAGRILVDVIPHVYDTERAVRIIGENDEQKIVRINQALKDGKMIAFGLGKYDVTISNGPSYQTKRQEAVAAMLEFTRSMPAQAAVVSDLLAKEMDWPGADEFAKRFKKTLPPGMADDEESGPAPIPPEIQAQMQQMQQQMQAMQQALQGAQQELQIKELDRNSKERIELAKIEANMRIELAKLQSQEATTLLRTEIDQINRQQENLGMVKEQQFAMPEQSDVSAYASPNPTGGLSPGQFVE